MKNDLDRSLALPRVQRTGTWPLRTLSGGLALHGECQQPARSPSVDVSFFYLLSKVRGMSLYWKFLEMWLAAQQGLTGHEGREGEKRVGQPSLRAVPPALGSE